MQGGGGDGVERPQLQRTWKYRQAGDLASDRRADSDRLCHLEQVRFLPWSPDTPYKSRTGAAPQARNEEVWQMTSQAPSSSGGHSLWNLGTVHWLG